MLTSFQFLDFRGFRDLKIDGLAPVTLITGANNTGKTGILEAFVLLFAPTQSRDFSNLPKAFRPTKLSGPNTHQVPQFWTWIVRKDSATRHCELSATSDKGATFRRFVGDRSTFRSSEQGWLQELEETGLNNKPWTFTVGKLPAPSIKAFGTAPTDPDLDAILVANLIKRKRLVEVVQILREVEPRLQSILPLPDETGGFTLHAEVGLPELIPTPQLGQGFGRLMTICSSATNEDAKVLLIDEVENGLYWKAMPEVWKGLFAMARTLGVQIIATTHSAECIRAAHEAARQGDSYDLAVIRLDRVDSEIKATVMGEETLRTAEEFGWEVR